MNTVLWDKNTVSVYAEVSDGSFVLPVPIRWLYHNRLKYNYVFYLQTTDNINVIISNYRITENTLVLFTPNGNIEVTDMGGSIPEGDGGGSGGGSGEPELYIIKGMIVHDNELSIDYLDTTVTVQDVLNAIADDKLPVMYVTVENSNERFVLPLSIYIPESDYLEIVFKRIDFNSAASIIYSISASWNVSDQMWYMDEEVLSVLGSGSDFEDEFGTYFLVPDQDVTVTSNRIVIHLSCVVDDSGHEYMPSNYAPEDIPMLLVGYSVTIDNYDFVITGVNPDQYTIFINFLGTLPQTPIYKYNFVVTVRIPNKYLEIKTL